MKTLVTAIIPVYNKAAVTGACLASMRSAKRRAELRIVAIDNASNPATRRVLARSGVEVVRNERNLGFIGAVNQGVRAFDSEWYLIGNSDIVVRDGWLDALLDAARTYGLGLAGYYGRTMVRDARAPVRPTVFVGLACGLVKKRVFDEVGLLDTRFGLGYYDDDDFCLRARLAGFRAGLVRNGPPGGTPFVTHYRSSSFKRDEKVRIMSENYRKFLRKWDPVYPRSRAVREYYETSLLDPTPWWTTGEELLVWFDELYPQLKERWLELHAGSRHGPIRYDWDSLRRIERREKESFRRGPLSRRAKS